MSGESMVQFDELVAIALDLLPKMARDNGLFSHKTVVESGSYRHIGHSELYSAISLVGILEYGPAESLRLGPVVERGLQALMRHSTQCADPAALGAIAWALALADDPGTLTVIERLAATLDVARASTMQLSLALAGAVIASGRRLEARDRAVRVAHSCHQELLRRWAPGGSVFRDTARGRTLGALAHSRIASFASQVYPLHGFALAEQHIGIPLPREARATADWLVESQGRHGEWWWWYGSTSRSVVEGYPVYSVHQDGMAFMALAPIQLLDGRSYVDSLLRGLDWVYGRNAINTSLVDHDPPFICRAIQRRGSDPDGFAGMSRRDRLLGVVSSAGVRVRSPIDVPLDGLEVLHECRSYHLGWLLYARSLMGRLGYAR